MTRLLFILIVLNAAMLVAVSILYRRARRHEEARKAAGAEKEYAAQYVRDLEARQRWESVDVSLLHEVNREELERTLEKLTATSVRALSSQERAFLDRMVEAERRVRRSRRLSSFDDSHGAGGNPTPAAG